MEQKNFWHRFGGLVIIAAGVLAVTLLNRGKSGEKAEYQKTVYSFSSMSTVFVFTLEGESDTVNKAAKAARNEVERIDKLCNYFDKESELSKLNASAYEKPFPCSEELWTILAACRKFHRLSGGAFDPTVRPLMVLYGFAGKRGKLPVPAEITEAKKKCGLDKVRFDDKAKTVHFTVKGMSLDLGGIAKGRAADLAAAAAETNGIHSGIINAGGNMRLLSSPWRDGSPYRIGIRDPKKKDAVIHTEEMRGGAVSTSGSYERYSMIDGKKISHIMNPVSGLPVDSNVLSVSVFAPDAMSADALSTTLYILGKERSKNLLKQLPGTKVLFLTEGENGGIIGKIKDNQKRP